MSTAAAGETALDLEVAEGVRALGAWLPLDADIPWVPAGTGGCEPCLGYLLRDGAGSLMVDTGLPAHAEAVVSALSRHLPPGEPLEIVITRIEADCVGNVSAILREWPVSRIVGFAVDPCEFFHQTVAPGARRARFELHRLGDTVQWGDGRCLELLAGPFGDLTTAWPFDPATGTLFTSDCFAWVHPREARGPWVLDAEPEGCDVALVRDHLHCKFDWLPNARVELVLEALRRVFEPRRVMALAPSHGCVLRGRSLVEAQYRLVRQAIQS